MSAQNPSERKVQFGLFFGLMLLLLVVWKGDGGYLDLMEYLNNAENMWLKGDVSIPGKPGTYYIHPLGIAFLSGPFVLAGAVVEQVSGGAIGHRAIAALSIPFFSALACVLLYNIGRELALSPLVSLWGAILLALGSPLILFSRFFFAEGGIAMSILLAVWAFLRARRSEGNVSIRWMLLAGAGLAGITACHFNNLFVSSWMWLGMAAAILSRKQLSTKTRAAMIAALTLIPILAGAALLYMNARRYGGPFHTGYETALGRESAHPISVLNMPFNFYYFERWLMRVPWVLPALFFLYKLWPRERTLAASLALAAITHIFFFQMFTGLRLFPIRYPQTAVIILSIGLLFVGDALWKKWQSRGLIYPGLLLIFWNLGYFIRFDSAAPSFRLSQTGDEVICYVWYMNPLGGKGLHTPMGTPQTIVFLVLLCTGLSVLALTVRAAQQMDSAQPKRA